MLTDRVNLSAPLQTVGLVLFLLAVSACLFVSSSPALAQFPDCDAADRECLELALAEECRANSATPDSCLSWLDRVEAHPSAGQPEWRLIAAGGYRELAGLVRDEQEGEQYRERSASIFREVLTYWPAGPAAQQAYFGLAILSYEDLDQRIALARSALQALPDHPTTLRLLAQSLVERGENSDLAEAAELYGKEHEIRRHDDWWMPAMNALQLFEATGQGSRAAEFKRQVAADSGMDEFIDEVTRSSFGDDTARAALVLDTACQRHIMAIFGHETCEQGIRALIPISRVANSIEHRVATAELVIDAMLQLRFADAYQYNSEVDLDAWYLSLLDEWIENGVNSAKISFRWAQRRADPKEAISALEYSVGLEPENGEYLYRLARAYFAGGQLQDALEFLKLARNHMDDIPGASEERFDELRRTYELAIGNRG